MNPDEEVRLESSGHAMDCDERREYPRTQEYGPAELLVQLTSSSGEQSAIRAVLWDFSQGGLGMDVEQPLPVGAEVSILGELRGADYSVEFRADARIAHCRRIEERHFRVGVAFLGVSYRRLAGGAEDTGEAGETN